MLPGAESRLATSGARHGYEDVTIRPRREEKTSTEPFAADMSGARHVYESVPMCPHLA